jgi:MoCo/4Fe-4S cofactor protein with predicted Tat translocation signal
MPRKDPTDYDTIRRRLAEGQGPRFWRSLEELAETEQFRELVGREFPAQSSQLASPANRRDFLRLMGASLALAGAQA